jgi:hypothetical protein
MRLGAEVRVLFLLAVFLLGWCLFVRGWGKGLWIGLGAGVSI